VTPPSAARADTPALAWAEILAMLNHYGLFWETSELADSPWPDDPDGGELRCVVALTALAQMAAALGPDAAISTERIRAHLSLHLAEGTAPPCCTAGHPCEPGYAHPATTEKRP
jgi:hypothetical protein